MKSIFFASLFANFNKILVNVLHIGVIALLRLTNQAQVTEGIEKENNLEIELSLSVWIPISFYNPSNILRTGNKSLHHKITKSI